MKKKAIIISIKGYYLSINEKKLLSKDKPWGLILFSRNIQSLEQIKKLIKNIRKLTKDPNFPILIDEEGADVSRLNKLFNHNISQNLMPRIYINGKKNLINRCLNNLIDNALKYSNKVKVCLNKKNTNLFISIDDDGPGIPKNEYDNVFKPFYKIDKGRADSKSSVGLGLSIASDIIRSHGGNIKLEKSKMKGLSVKIFSPL